MSSGTWLSQYFRLCSLCFLLIGVPKLQCQWHPLWALSASQKHRCPSYHVVPVVHWIKTHCWNPVLQTRMHPCVCFGYYVFNAEICCSQLLVWSKWEMIRNSISICCCLPGCDSPESRGEGNKWGSPGKAALWGSPIPGGGSYSSSCSHRWLEWCVWQVAGTNSKL